LPEQEAAAASVVFQHASTEFSACGNAPKQLETARTPASSNGRRGMGFGPISFSYRPGHFFHLSHVGHSP